MLRREFESLVGQVPDEVWNMADLVYHWYPANWEKDQFAMIYTLGGVSLLQDVTSRAQVMMNIATTKTAVHHLLRELEDLESKVKEAEDPSSIGVVVDKVSATLKALLDEIK